MINLLMAYMFPGYYGAVLLVGCYLGSSGVRARQ